MDSSEKLDRVLVGIKKDPAAFRRLLETFCKSIENGETVDPDYFDFIAEVLRKLLSKKDKDRTLNSLNPGTKLNNLKRDISITKHMIQLMTSGSSFESAREETGDKYSLSGSTVEKIYIKYKEIVQQTPNL